MRIKRYLFENGIQVQDFATELGVSRSYLSVIINGRKAVTRKLASKIEQLTGGKIKARSIAGRYEKTLANKEQTPNFNLSKTEG